MSDLARWSYNNVATVYPFVSQDDFGGDAVYGTPYEIACDYIAGGTEVRYQNGDQLEFVAKSIIWTEDARPKYRDQIEMPGTFGRETIRSTKAYPAANLGLAGQFDYELATG